MRSMIRLSPTGLDRGLALLVVGGVGAWIGTQIGIPAGVVIGALVASGVYRIVGGEPGPWRERYGQMGRLLLGTVIGAAFGSDVVAPLKAALLPMIVLVVVIVGVGLFLGWALGRFTTLDTATGLISSMPGGLPAMAAIADESDADVTVVMAIHFSRLVTILLVVPALIPFLTTASGGTATLAVEEPVGLQRTMITLAVGLVSGLLAARLRVPTGDLIGPILTIGGLNLLGSGLGPLAQGFRTTAFLLIGTAVGTQMSRESLRLLRHVALPAVVVIATLVSVGLALGWGLSQVTSLDMASALLSAVPGGATTMPAVAHDLGGDMRLVAALHLTRQLVIFVLVPSLLSYLLRRRRREPVSAIERG
jgi:membrane AbrB-like protein